jgi:ribokinase
MMSQKNKWDIVVVGGANMDYLVRGKALPKPGETLIGDVFQEAPGGKGANQAIAAARLGGRVAFVARLGGDARGRIMAKRLREEGVNTRYVVRDRKEATGVALILVGEGGEKAILSAPGANLQFNVHQVREAARAIQSAAVLLLQLEVPLEAVMLSAQLASGAGRMVVLDPAPAIPLPDELLRMVNVIRPNAREAEVLTGVPARDRDSARDAAKRLLERGVGAVAVQAGDEGNLIVTSDNEHWFPKIPVQSIDATGAGDAFAAALAVALAEGRPWEEAGAWASAAAALKTTHLGAQAGLPMRDQVLALAAREHPSMGTGAKRLLPAKEHRG